ncbi:MAG: metallopeptidase family protein [Chloroflexaceae bacterium]|nr:metallopeptidase family protein [Chloroflexaceae bacterium]NJO04330.1 metallopeptidase family protein [Chloroflexaceae bacterium]
MDQSTFEQLVIDVLDNVPPEFARHLANVEVIIEPYVTDDHRDALDLEPDERVYGYYEGIPLTERMALDVAPPDTIVIFQEPLEQDFPNIIDLREEVRRTVLHEIAHFFGISDERLDELGAY